MVGLGWQTRDGGGGGVGVDVRAEREDRSERVGMSLQKGEEAALGLEEGQLVPGQGGREGTDSVGS